LGLLVFPESGKMADSTKVKAENRRAAAEEERRDWAEGGKGL